MSASGNLVFAKYAYSPNKLGYCGPDNYRGIFDYCVAKQSDEGLVELLKGFEGAYPYLKLIAHANRLKDPFDKRVVEAYWIGNELLNNVSTQDFYDSIKNRFSKKINKNAMKWLLTKPPAGAKPHHSFHVLDVYTKTGLIRSGIRTNILETINNCLIMWGRVNHITCSAKHVTRVEIQYQPIILQKGKLVFGEKKEKIIESLFIQPKNGDQVSFHWGKVCDILSEEELVNLKKWTAYHLGIANLSI